MSRYSLHRQDVLQAAGKRAAAAEGVVAEAARLQEQAAAVQVQARKHKPQTQMQLLQQMR